MEDLRSLIPDWKIHLRAKNLADRTIESYIPIAEAFVAWLESNRMSTDADVPAGTLEIYLAHLRISKSKRTKRTLSAAEIAKRYRSLQQFFRWISDVEEIIPVSPFVKLSAPAVPVQPVPILREEQLRSLIEKTTGKSFEHRRDEALLRFFADTGARCEEVTTLSVEDLDFELCVARVVGKGRRSRDVSFGPRTAEALRRYLRLRAKHPKAQGRSELWIGREGPLTHFGVRQMVYRRCGAAGLPKVHPHTFRHTFAHTWLLNGGQETDLMRLTGWRSRVMVDRYGASAADERARQAHQKAGLGDRY
jgi:site-specific recombinase XerD